MELTYINSKLMFNFAKWIVKEGYVFNGEPALWNLGGMFSKRYTDNEIYQLFLNKTKNQSVNIYEKKGDRVIYTGKGGHDYDKKNADQYLTVGKEYTIDYTEVSGWHTDVYLLEVTGTYTSGNRIHFNSVMFEDA